MKEKLKITVQSKLIKKDEQGNIIDESIKTQVLEGEEANAWLLQQKQLQ